MKKQESYVDRLTATGVPDYQHPDRGHEEFIYYVLMNTPFSFGAALRYHMNRLQWIVNDLAAESDVSAETILRILNDEVEPIPLETVISLCIGLHLETNLSLDMVRKAGYYLDDSPLDSLYKFMLRSMKSYSVSECNDILKARNIPQLSPS